MWFEGTIYEAGGFNMKSYSKNFIDAFLTKPEFDFPLKNGITDQDYSGTKEYIKKFKLDTFARKALLIVYEIEPGIWSLNLAQDPDVIIAQIDHNDKMLRVPEVTSNEAKTAQYYTQALFNKVYTKNYSTKRGQVLKPQEGDYTKTSEVITKDFTNSKYITRLDISSLWNQ